MKEPEVEMTAAAPGTGPVRENGEEMALRSLDDIRTTVVELARQANRQLLLHAAQLDAAIFNQQPFLDALTRLLLSHRDACVLVLIHDGRKAVQSNTRLVELSRRLSTRLQIRQPAVEYRDCQQTMLLADATGFLLCPLPGRYQGYASFNNPGKVRDMNQYFMEVWEHAEPDSETRRLYL